MPIIDSFPQGTPIWVDLQSRDQAGAAAFYRQLFGWEVPPASAETGGYSVASMRGVPVTAIGPLPMPTFSPSQMSEQEMSAIAHYVQYLHHPADPGGLGISHFGPVAEGFVGVILGFGFLWLAVRMIGTRG